MGALDCDQVLDCAIPDDHERKTKLNDEVLRRAKAAFQVKNLPSAEKLYTRSIEIFDDDHIPYSNRAAVRLLYGKNEKALKDCEKCLDIEPTFTKAHYRKCQALQRLERFQDALDHCALSIEMLGEKDTEIFQTLEKEIQSDWEADKAAKAKIREEAKEIDNNMPPPMPTRILPKREVKKEEDEDSKLRGYKKTADGKTTSYFHTELDEDAKKLIGSCAPTKIEGGAPAPKDEVGGDTSVWNAAGTFEQKSLTEWMQAEVKKAVKKGTLETYTQDVDWKLDTVNGDASRTSSRGKVKFMHDISVKLKWTTEGAEGTILFEHDGDGEWDVVVEVSKCDSVKRQFVNDHVKKSGAGLQKLVLEKLDGVQERFLDGEACKTKE